MLVDAMLKGALFTTLLVGLFALAYLMGSIHPLLALIVPVWAILASVIFFLND